MLLVKLPDNTSLQSRAGKCCGCREQVRVNRKQRNRRTLRCCSRVQTGGRPGRLVQFLNHDHFQGNN